MTDKKISTLIVMAIFMTTPSYGEKPSADSLKTSETPIKCKSDPVQLQRYLAQIQNSYTFLLQKQLFSLDQFNDDIKKADKPDITDSLLDAAVTFTISAVLTAVIGPVGGFAGKKLSEMLQGTDPTKLAKIGQVAGHCIAESVADGIKVAAKDQLKGIVSRAIEQARSKGTAQEQMFVETTKLAMIETQKKVTEEFIKSKHQFETERCGLENAIALYDAVEAKWQESLDIQYASAVRSWAKLLHGNSACRLGKMGGPHVFNWDVPGQVKLDPNPKGMLFVDVSLTQRHQPESFIINFAAMPGMNQEIRKRLINNYQHLLINDVAYALRVILHTKRRDYIIDENRVSFEKVLKGERIDFSPCIWTYGGLNTDDWEFYSYTSTNPSTDEYLNHRFYSGHSWDVVYDDLKGPANELIINIRNKKLKDLKEIRDEVKIEL